MAMRKRTAKRRSTQDKRTPVSGFRLTARALDRFDRIGDHFGVNRATAVDLASILAERALGLDRLDAVAAIEGLERRYGPDAVLHAEVDQYDVDDEGAAVHVTVTINGEEVEGWEGGMGLGRVQLTPDSPFHITGNLSVRHAPSQSYFSLGVVEEPRSGSNASIRVADLVDTLITLAEGKTDPGDLRRQVRADLKLLALVRDTNADEEEAPVDEDSRSRVLPETQSGRPGAPARKGKGLTAMPKINDSQGEPFWEFDGEGDVLRGVLEDGEIADWTHQDGREDRIPILTIRTAEGTARWWACTPWPARSCTRSSRSAAS
jgi:hypothetical protein